MSKIIKFYLTETREKVGSNIETRLLLIYFTNHLLPFHFHLQIQNNQKYEHNR